MKLNSKDTIDLPLLIKTKLLVQANSGGGKSWLLRRILEQTHGKVQQIVIDPEGEFGSLRQKYDYVLAGKGGDVAAEPRTAALLARRLLETRANAIIDLYELPPQERKRFVRLFLDAMMNAPKELYHEVLVVLDEAHIFVPEKEQSEAASAVVDLCSRGRKRGFCAILATQRISKLAKDAAAECNNKLIGRTSLDIDIKRAGEELGFTAKEQLRGLRTLKPGEFFAFGPAITNEVKQVKIGEVFTDHPDVGGKKVVHTPPPTAAIKKMLDQFKDLPAEAEQEARTVAELKVQIAELKRRPVIRDVAVKEVKTIDAAHTEREVARAVKERDAQWKPQVDKANKEIGRLGRMVDQAMKILGAGETTTVIELVGPPALPISVDVKSVHRTMENVKTHVREENADDVNSQLTSAEQKILDAVAFFESIGVPTPEKAAAAAVAGFRPTSGHFKNSCGALRSKGLVEYPGGNIALTSEGRQLAVMNDAITSNEDLHERIMQKLDTAQKRILQPLLNAYPQALSSIELAEQSGFQETSGHFKNVRGSLKTYGLVEYPSPGQVRARSILFPL